MVDLRERVDGLELPQHVVAGLLVEHLQELDRVELPDRSLAGLVDVAEDPAAELVEDLVAGDEVRIAERPEETFPVERGRGISDVA